MISTVEVSIYTRVVQNYPQKFITTTHTTNTPCFSYYTLIVTFVMFVGNIEIVPIHVLLVILICAQVVLIYHNKLILISTTNTLLLSCQPLDVTIVSFVLVIWITLMAVSIVNMACVFSVLLNRECLIMKATLRTHCNWCTRKLRLIVTLVLGMRKTLPMSAPPVNSGSTSDVLLRPRWFQILLIITTLWILSTPFLTCIVISSISATYAGNLFGRTAGSIIATNAHFLCIWHVLLPRTRYLRRKCSDLIFSVVITFFLWSKLSCLLTCEQCSKNSQFNWLVPDYHSDLSFRLIIDFRLILSQYLNRLRMISDFCNAGPQGWTNVISHNS